MVDWWGGLCRLQPGSASGTQAQESWHRHRLKKRIGNLRQDVPSFVASLRQFCTSRLQQLRLSRPCLPDITMEPFPVKVVLDDSLALTKLGRSSTDQYHSTAAYEMFPGELGGVWYCMRQTLATYNREEDNG